jgi:hypothetical protein
MRRLGLVILALCAVGCDPYEVPDFVRWESEKAGIVACSEIQGQRLRAKAVVTTVKGTVYTLGNGYTACYWLRKEDGVRVARMSDDSIYLCGGERCYEITSATIQP